MNRQLNSQILRLSIPSILANITVPLVGMVDTAVAGHLSGSYSAATFIGAISIGSMMFSLLYWNFSFLRTGTGGLTAQSYGRRDFADCGYILLRALCMSAAVALVCLLIQSPFLRLVGAVTNASEEVELLAARYFRIRIWAAPATISLMAFRGWFVGMQDSMSSMWTDLIINVVNIASSILLSFGVGSAWQGLGFEGIAAGTLIAQYCGLLFCLCTVAFKYFRKVFPSGLKPLLGRLLHDKGIGEFFAMNGNLLARSLFFILIYMGYTMIAAGFGDLQLSCSSIMMQLLMIFSYFTDGFAYAAEALTGRFIGEKNIRLLKQSIKYVFVWSMSIALGFVVFYMAAGVPLLSVMTSDGAVIGECSKYLWALALMPPLGCAAFTWDGVFLGATSSRQLRDSMGGAALCFFALWWGVGALTDVNAESQLHILLLAYFAHLLFRTVYLSVSYSRSLKKRLEAICAS